MYSSGKMAYANILQFFIDLLSLLAAFLTGYIIASRISVLLPIREYIWSMFVYVPIWIFSMSAMSMYNKTTFKYYDRILRDVLKATLFSGVIVAAIFFYTKNILFSRKLFTILIICTIVYVLAERYLLLFFYNRKNANCKTHVIIIGQEDLIKKFEYYIHKTEIKMNVDGYLQLSDKYPVTLAGCLGNIDKLPEILRHNIIDEVIFVISRDHLDEIEEYVLLCEKMGHTVKLVTDLFDLKIAKVQLTSVGPMTMLTYYSVTLNNVQQLLKRIVDIAGALVGLIFTAFISIFVMPAIKLDSPGPIFFRHDRVGTNGRIFRLVKFRSMCNDAEKLKASLEDKNEVKDGLLFKMKDDPRITKVGKFLRTSSIDELPQFWNVLTGDMSLVGTRPPTKDEVAKYLDGHRRRISIKPGLTGMWQISGRSKIMNFDEVTKLDTYYIDNWSLAMDFKIIMKTIPAVLRRRGAM